MYLNLGPFQRPWICTSAMWCAFPNAVCSGLLRKPLDTTIWQLLSLHCPGGCQGNIKQNNNEKMYHLLTILMVVAVHWYNIVCITRWRKSRAILDATGCHHRASIVANSSHWSYQCQFLFVFFHDQLVEKGCGLRLRSLFWIGVWHINLIGRT